MTQGEMIVLSIFGAGIFCSLFLLFWLIRIIKRDARQRGKS